MQQQLVMLVVVIYYMLLGLSCGFRVRGMPVETYNVFACSLCKQGMPPLPVQ